MSKRGRHLECTNAVDAIAKERETDRPTDRLLARGYALLALSYIMPEECTQRVGATYEYAVSRVCVPVK